MHPKINAPRGTGKWLILALLYYGQSIRASLNSTSANSTVFLLLLRPQQVGRVEMEVVRALLAIAVAVVAVVLMS